MPDFPKKRRRVVKPGPMAERSADRLKGQAASPERLRQLFNERRILEETRAGRLNVRILRDGHPSPPLADEPFCTKSQLLGYYDQDGKEIARAHQYLRTDGTIGAHGRPDPKKVVHEGVLYFLDVP